MFALVELAKVEPLHKSIQTTPTLKFLPNINQFIVIKKIMHILKDFVMKQCIDCSNTNLEILNYTYIYIFS